MERIEDFSIPVIYSTCTSGAGVASGKREARRKTVGRLVCTWRRRVGAPIPPPFSVYALCAPCHPLSVRGADGGRGSVGRRGSEASFGVWGRPTAEPCFSRPANSRAEPSSRSRSSSLSSSSSTDPTLLGSVQPCKRGPSDATFSHPRRVPRSSRRVDRLLSSRSRWKSSRKVAVQNEAECVAEDGRERSNSSNGISARIVHARYNMIIGEEGFHGETRSVV